MIFIDEKLPINVIIDCRITLAHKFRTRLGFKQYDVILTKQQSVLTKLISSFEGENMQIQYVLSYRINLGHSKLISCSMGPTDCNFRKNKKIIILISSQNKK